MFTPKYLIWPLFKESAALKNCTALFVTICMSFALAAQSVTGIITDYNGYWKTGVSAVNAVKPDNDHDLLAFTFNGVQYSTGVNDELLASNTETFTPGVFRALPMQNINGTPTSNTKIGLGAMADGVYNGAGTPPSRSLAQYLNDGVNGLNLGTCVANLPSGTMFMPVTNVQVEHIGDGIPDILVTQIADPSGQYDRYEFTDINGNRVGNYMDIILTNITPVGAWTADFYEATGSTILGGSFRQTSRDIRLWAADFSAFGINASNIGDIAYFKIGLNGNSDIAFVAYNTTTVTMDVILGIGDPMGERLARAVSREEVKTLSVYPNPATQYINLSHPVAKANEKILIYDINGLLVASVNAGSRSNYTRLSISSLRAGTYHAVFTDGKVKLAKKIIVQ